MDDGSPTADGEGPTTQLIVRGGRRSLVHRAATLHVKGGPDAGQRLPLGLARVRIGTAPENDLVLSDPQVSRFHLEVQLEDAGYRVVDLDSTNGTYLGEGRVHDLILSSGMVLTIGATTLALEEGEQESQEVSAAASFGELVGTSAAMREVFGLLQTVAPTELTVLIEGETGTGKELVARAIHQRSPRAERPYWVVDCGSLPPTLIESELFGHEKGAFTGADRTREGVFEKARGGCVFLDELGELPLELQTRLLRVLEAREVRRVGGDVVRRVDARIIAATNRDLRKEVDAGRFRRDLYYRLAVVRIPIPPLRERSEDIPLLARHFLRQAGAPDPDRILRDDVIRVLRSRNWPGNARELRNAVERALLFSAQRKPFSTDAGVQAWPTRAEEVRAAVTARPTTPPPQAPAATPTADDPRDDHWLSRSLPAELWSTPYKELKERVAHDLERLYLERLLARHGRNVSQIAKDAGIDRHMVRKLLRKHAFDD